MRTIVIDNLSTAEKLELIDEFWEGLEAEDIPQTQAQMDEIDRRLATADEDAAAGKTWEQVLEGLGRTRK